MEKETVGTQRATMVNQDALLQAIWRAAACQRKPVQLEDHVTDLATGFAGVVVEQRQRAGKPTLLMVAPDRVALGRKLAVPRLVPEPQVRVDHAIRRAKEAPVAGAPARYTHPQQEAMAAVLWQFAADLLLRPQQGEAICNGTGLPVSREHVQRALDGLTAALGYVPAATS